MEKKFDNAIGGRDVLSLRNVGTEESGPLVEETGLDTASVLPPDHLDCSGFALLVADFAITRTVRVPMHFVRW